jgi:hypothetical protein
MKALNVRVVLNRKFYKLRIVIEAPREQAETILNSIRNALIKAGAIL